MKSLNRECCRKRPPKTEDRLSLKAFAERGAAYFILYGLSREGVEYVFITFPGAQRKDEREHGYFRTAKLTLARYDTLASQR